MEANKEYKLKVINWKKVNITNDFIIQTYGKGYVQIK